MNPVLLGKQVEEGLKELVRSSFETTSPAYVGMIDAFLARPSNFLKGPWISVDLPFRPAESAREFFPDIPLGFRAHRHQELAFRRLAGARSTLIATGTGSGKTESFLWPILDACRLRKGSPGIKAIIIYPMNALATDQAKRIARAIARTPALNGVRCGIYADAEPAQATDEMTEHDVITSRRQMLINPPDILLTNYKMLDLLLLRGRDKPLWARNGPETLKYLVVDELHTFDGAQGADLALLIRRLKARLSTPEGHLACVGSSATLGVSAEAAAKLLSYASDLFGEPFDATAVIREDRLAIHEYLSAIDYAELPGAPAVEAAVARAIDLSQAEAAGALAGLFFDDLDPTSAHFDRSVSADPNAVDFRMALGQRLKQHVAFHRVVEALQTQGRAALLSDVVQHLATARLFRDGWAPQALGALVEAVVILTAWARSGDSARPAPLLNVRVQSWARELRRMVATVPGRTPDGELVAPELSHSDDLEPVALLRTLPVIHCSHCGATGQVGRLHPSGGGVGANLETIYEEFFEGGGTLRFFYFEPLRRLNQGAGYGAVFPGYINPDTLACDWRPHTKDDDDLGRTPIWMFDPIGDDGRVDRTCPSCGTKHSLQILGLRSARLAASLSTSLFNSQHHESDENAKPRVLVFSDSVQDAAQRAAVSEIRNAQTVFRKALYRGVASASDRTIPLDQLINTSIPALRQDLGEANFIARHIARDQTWRKTYVELAEEDKEPDTPGLGHDVALRLGWEFFSDLTYRSRTSQTLETARLAIADVSPLQLADVARELVGQLPAKMGQSFALNEEDAFAFLWGLCTNLRRSGAVTHTYIAAAAEHATNRLNFFAARRVMGVHAMNVLPTPDQRTSAAPLLPTLRASSDGFVPVARDSPTNWYRAWANRFFGQQNPLLAANYADLYACVFETLQRAALLAPLDGSGADPIRIWALPIEAVSVSTNVAMRACDRCGRRETTLPMSGETQLSCLRISCEGRLQPVEHTPSAHMQRVMETTRNHRVVAREHTGILDPDARRALEAKFISGEQPWHPNLISATPTLEMGIDIGDLSTLILASMPPEEANYVQRIGRTGRRDGNSLNITLIAARAHDLQFWEEPASMLMGEVSPPGVHLQAVAVLRRQSAAFALDNFVAASETAVAYGTVSVAIAALDRSVNADFPLNWFHHLNVTGRDIAQRFIALLPPDVQQREDLVQQLTDYILNDDEGSLRYRVRAAFDAARQERTELLAMQRGIDADRTKLKRASPPPRNLDEELERLTRKRSEISRTIRETIDRVEVLKFMTDRGLLPNYAFPEEGVKLKAFIIKSAEVRGDDDKAAEADLVVREYMRPASSALTELAPEQTFYAEGRQLTIDRLELRGEDLSSWRFCPRCVYAEPGISAGRHSTCPKCHEQMWSDIGSEAETVELRTVVATSTEQKAAIRDLDDRTSRRYDRYLSPAYDPKTVEHAYVLSDENIGAPFAYEFIPTCEFRDLNFGVKTTARTGRTIAGEQRQSRPFPICRHCGKLQTDQSADGQHQARCPADGGREPRPTWESNVYLMRRFSTEALRLIVPVAGLAQDDEIKSFVAAIELGLRKHFAGRVDHLRNAVIEERLPSGARVRNLYLFDNIPGGSGYLRQLAADPRTMRRVFELAANALRECPCAEDPAKNGCFRCVKAYRSMFGAGEPRRHLALQLVEAVLAGWDSLTRAERPINDVLGADLVESELEARFLDSLGRAFPQNLKPIVLENGRRGFQLKVNLQAQQEAFWLIEPQVQIDQRFHGLPTRRVDFLFTSKTWPELKPIVVELDGWEFHARTLAKDIEDRLLMRRSGQVEVWTLTWGDLDALSQQALANPFAEGTIAPAVEGALAQLWAHQRFAALRPYRRPVERLRNASSLEAFIDRLRGGPWTAAEGLVLLMRLSIGQSGTPFQDLPRLDLLDNDARLFLQDAALFGAANAGAINLYFGAPQSSPETTLASLQDFRLVVRADMTADVHARLLDPSAQQTWRSLWRLINLAQDVAGLHVVFPALDTLSAPSLRRSLAPERGDDPAWNAVAALLDEDMGAVLTALRAGGASLPDMAGEDFLVGDKVAGMVEFGWRDRKVLVTAESFSADGWSAFPAVLPSQPGFANFIERVLAALQSERP